MSLWLRETFEVVGFLKEGSSILYQGDPAYGIDRAILIPYPSIFEGLASPEDEFGGTALFAYANGEIAISKGSSVDGLLDALERIAQSSGYTDYGVAGLYDYSTRMALVRRLICDNVAAVDLMTALLTGVGGGAVAAADFSVARRCSRRRRVALLLGEQGKWRRVAAEPSLVWSAATAVLLLVLERGSPYWSPVCSGMTLGILAVIALLDVGLCLGLERWADR